jgi:predicted nuclease of predicted toxin-antitoxin system
MKILIDMNLSPDWCQALNQVGLEAIHWSTVGNPTAPDKILMEWAKKHGYIVFTHDLDFGSILAATQADAPSVIQVRVQDTLPEGLVNTVVAVLKQFESQLRAGALITIDPTKSRIRILPIGIDATNFNQNS